MNVERVSAQDQNMSVAIQRNDEKLEKKGGSRENSTIPGLLLLGAVTEEYFGEQDSVFFAKNDTASDGTREP